MSGQRGAIRGALQVTLASMGRRRDRKSDAPVVEPVDVDGVWTLAIITVLWAVAFVVLAFQRAALIEADLGWWLWTCLAGVGLGLIGLEYCRKRRDAIAREELHEEADADLYDDWLGTEEPESVAVEDPVRAGELPAEPQPESYPADAPLPESYPAAAPLPERPVHAEPAEQFGYGTAEEVPPMHHPDDQYRHREGRPPPGYVTGDLPVVPPQQPPQQPPVAEPAPTEPAPAPAAQPWHDQPWPPPEAPEPEVPQDTPPPSRPGFPYHPATPAGYSPEPDLARRHPRDIEIARRRETEGDQIGGTTGLPAPVEFLHDEPEPPAAAPQKAPDIAPDLLGPEPDAGPPSSHHTPGAASGPEPPPAPGEQAEQPPAEPDLVSEFFSDIPAGSGTPAPVEQADEDPDLLLGDTPRAPGRRARRDPEPGSSGEYRGRRARRD